MISMTIVGSAGSAASYFAKDNYYTREQNEAQSAWAGSLAQDIGLRARVDADTFRELLSGRIGSDQLGKLRVNEKGVAETKHLPGYDITFSAPKSVSILAEVFGRSEVQPRSRSANVSADSNLLFFGRFEHAFSLSSVLFRSASLTRLLRG